MEAKRILPFLHNRLNGMCVYVPTPDVSMFDLTLRFDKDDDAIIAAQKEKVFTSFLTKNMHIYSYKKLPPRIRLIWY